MSCAQRHRWPQSFPLFCAAALLAGCGSRQGPRPPVPRRRPTATRRRAPPIARHPPAATVRRDWKTFTTSDGTLAFDYPAAWTVKDPAEAAAEGGVFVELVSDYGKTMATLRTNMVTGAECTEKFPFMVYDAEPVPALAQGGRPRGSSTRAGPTRREGSAESLTLAYGITSAPEPAGDTACPIFHFFTWPPSGAMFGGVYDPFDTTPGAPQHVDTPEVYMDTAEYKNIKRRSLRCGRPGSSGHEVAGGIARRCTAWAAKAGATAARRSAWSCCWRPAACTPAEPGPAAGEPDPAAPRPVDHGAGGPRPTEGTPSSGWKTFTTTDGGLSFDYPAGWTVGTPAGRSAASSWTC